jgi:hypothetical protein
MHIVGRHVLICLEATDSGRVSDGAFERIRGLLNQPAGGYQDEYNTRFNRRSQETLPTAGTISGRPACEPPITFASYGLRQPWVTIT